jgi:excisionase family DNA binding protein
MKFDHQAIFAELAAVDWSGHTRLGETSLPSPCVDTSFATPIDCCPTPSCPVAVEQPSNDDWMTTEQVADYLHLTPKTIREGAVKKTLPGHKYPPRCRRGRWRFKKDDIDRFLRKPAPPRRLPEPTVWN